MRKYFLGFLIAITCISGSSFGMDLELSVKESKYTENEVKISYGIINKKNFPKRNVKIAFKILADNKPVACKEINLDVPANSTGDQIMEVIIPAPCENNSCKVAAQVFDSSIKKYRIDNWMSECPRN